MTPVKKRGHLFIWSLLDPSKPRKRLMLIQKRLHRVPSWQVSCELLSCSRVH